MRIKRSNKSLPYLLLGASISLFFLAGRAAAQENPDEWKRNWGVAEGFAIDIDTDGNDLPSAIAFIPEPGRGAKDLLYPVTDPRGTIQGVTNDRSVSTFAEDFLEADTQGGVNGVLPPARWRYVIAAFLIGTLLGVYLARSGTWKFLDRVKKKLN